MSITKGLANQRIIVVGAGVAGLSAADYLCKNGAQNLTLVLEAATHVGGRARATGVRGSISSSPPAGSSAGAQQSNFLFASTGQAITGSKSTFATHLFREIMKDATQRSDNSANSETLHCLLTRLKNKKLRNVAMERDQSAHRIIDALICARRIRFGTDLQNVQASPINLHELDHDMNGKELLEPLAVSVTCPIKCGMPVGNINWDCNNRHIVVSCIDETAYDADYVICTLPLGVLKNLHTAIFTPPLPVEKVAAISNVGFGIVEKVFLTFDTPVSGWLPPGRVQLLWTPDELANRTRWTTGICDVQPITDRTVEVSIAGNQGEDMLFATENQVGVTIVDTLKRFIGNPTIPYPVEVIRSDWSKSALSLGSFPFMSVTSAMNNVQWLESSLPPNERTTPRLLFAGDATVLNSFGTERGAQLSGIRAANRIIQLIKHKI